MIRNSQKHVRRVNINQAYLKGLLTSPTELELQNLHMLACIFITIQATAWQLRATCNNDQSLLFVELQKHKATPTPNFKTFKNCEVLRDVFKFSSAATPNLKLQISLLLS